MDYTYWLERIFMVLVQQKELTDQKHRERMAASIMPMLIGSGWPKTNEQLFDTALRLADGLVARSRL